MKLKELLVHIYCNQYIELFSRDAKLLGVFKRSLIVGENLFDLGGFDCEWLDMNVYMISSDGDCLQIVLL